MIKFTFRSTIAVIILSPLIFLIGCVSQPKMYYFGDYSRTLYTMEKNQNDESLLKHKQELEKIITESEKIKRAVPPGIYAELGYINLKANNTNEAVRLFQKESEIYPESKYFMDRLIKKATLKDNADTGSPDSSTENISISN
jgi:hypothetical protein